MEVQVQEQVEVEEQVQVQLEEQVKSELKVAVDLRALEALPLHDVAPVAGGVAYAEEHQLPLLPRHPQGLLPPGVPAHTLPNTTKLVI